MKEIRHRRESTDHKTGDVTTKDIIGLIDSTKKDEEVQIRVAFTITTTTPSKEVTAHLEDIVDRARGVLAQAIKPNQIDAFGKKGAA